MKFALFFILLAAYFISLIVSSESSLIFILLWPVINLNVLAVAYVINLPNLILGKQKNGKVNPILLLINLPWLLLTWFIFKIQIKLSRENFADKIGNTNIWISRRPSGESLEEYDLVIDLTAEFFKDNTDKYVSYPNLDGHSLKNLPDPADFHPDKKTLIHCANGHGRSALFTSHILKMSGVCENFEESMEMILKSRPLAKPNKSQKKWLFEST